MDQSDATPTDVIKPVAPSWVPPKVAMVLGTISIVLTAAAAFVPAPWSGLVAIVGFCGAALSGTSLPQLKFAVGKPLVGPAAVTTVGLVGAGVEQLASSGALTGVGTWQQALIYGGSALLAWLAGKAAPTLAHASPPAAPTIDTPQKAVAEINRP